MQADDSQDRNERGAKEDAAVAEVDDVCEPVFAVACEARGEGIALRMHPFRCFDWAFCIHSLTLTGTQREEKKQRETPLSTTAQRHQAATAPLPLSSSTCGSRQDVV